MQGMPANQIPSPVYLLASSEPLLLRDWLDQFREMLRNAGFEDIQTLITESGFDWSTLLEEGNMLSLFASRKCRIVNIINGKPGKKGGKVMQAISDNPPSDTIYVFVVPGLDGATRNAGWYKHLRQAAELVELKPVYTHELSNWIRQRARQKGVNIDQPSAEFLAECTEGNLLAADQELEKLAIRFTEEQAVSLEIIKESVAQSARYNHFILVDACLAGQAARALKILGSLKSEGCLTTQLRWALQAALEQLSGLELAQSKNRLDDRVWQTLRIWKSKQRLYQNALARLGRAQIERLLQSCARLDRISKGWQAADFPDQDWLHLKLLISQFCGVGLQTALQE